MPFMSCKICYTIPRSSCTYSSKTFKICKKKPPTASDNLRSKANKIHQMAKQRGIQVTHTWEKGKSTYRSICWGIANVLLR